MGFEAGLVFGAVFGFWISSSASSGIVLNHPRQVRCLDVGCACSMCSAEPNRLCLECGLCCNGVIFADVRLEPGDDATRLQALGLPLAGGVAARAKGSCHPQFSQPCARFDGCRCRIYADRPKYCREFDCLLLRSQKEGRVGTAAARQVIRRALKSADKVKGLLRELGDADDHVALGVRFRRMQKRMERRAVDGAAAEIFGRLTLAMHELNLLLSERFYPGAADAG